jgi:Ca2+-binding RTX toxin-like protein
MIVGGPLGIDTATFRRSGKPVRVDNENGIAQGQGQDVLRGISVVVGSQHSDVLQADALRGLDGDDLLVDIFTPDDDGFDGGNIRGGLGNDRLRGGSGSEALQGGPGDDIIVGGPGDDYLEGDANNRGRADDDVLYGGAGADTMHADPSDYRRAAGNDELHGGSGPDRLHADGFGFDNPNMDAGDDVLYGDAGPDWLSSDPTPGFESDPPNDGGADRLFGGTGDDHLLAGGHMDHGDGGFDHHGDSCLAVETAIDCEHTLH